VSTVDRRPRIEREAKTMIRIDAHRAWIDDQLSKAEEARRTNTGPSPSPRRPNPRHVETAAGEER
jgi:hypothetical protein